MIKSSAALILMSALSVFAPTPASAADATNPVLVPVWSQWRDPVLDRLQAQALAHAPSIAQALARVEESRANAKGAGAELWPTVNAALSGQRDRATAQELEQSFGTIGRYRNLINAGVDLRWEIDLFGAKRAQRAAVLAHHAAANHAVDAARLRLLAEVARQYVVLRGGDAQQTAERRLVNLLSEQDAIDSTLERTGLLADLDRKPVQAELVERRASLRDGEFARLAALAQLRALISADVLDVATPPQHLQSTLPACRSTPATQVPISVLANRPDVRGAQAALAAASAQAQAAQRLRWPSLSLNGRGGWTAGSGHAFIRPANLGAQLLASLGLPLIDFGRLKAQSQAAAAQRDASEAALAETILLAAEEVDLSLVAVSRAGHAADHFAQAHRAAQTAADITRARRHAGLDSRRRQIEAERAAIEREIANVAAEQALCEAQIRFTLATAPAPRPQARNTISASPR